MTAFLSVDNTYMGTGLDEFFRYTSAYALRAACNDGDLVLEVFCHAVQINAKSM